MTNELEAGVKRGQFGDLVVVQPMLEPWPSKLWKLGPIAVFFYARWSSWSLGLGVEILGAGFALCVGPFMIGACHIQRQIEHGDAITQGATHDR